MIAKLAMCFAGLVIGAAAQGDIVCLPSAPSAQAGASIKLSVLYRASANATSEFKWSASAGSIRAGETRNGRGVAVWDLKNVHPGPAYADVDAIVNGAKAVSCSVELRVEGEPPVTREAPSASPVPPSPAPVGAERGVGGGSRVALSGRGYLAPGEVEPDGYGLYSYVLFGAPPASADRDRYIAIFEAVERLLRPVADLARSLKPSQLNATWLPVKSVPASDPDAKWLVDNYDYSAATVDLARAGIKGNSAGVYIVSSRAPLSRGNASPPFLLQNLSHVPATLASTWVTLFINQAAQERFWNAGTVDQLLAKMRLAISLTAEGVPEIKSAVATLISVSK